MVIAAVVAAGLALSAVGFGFGRGEQRTLFTVDACPDPSPGPEGKTPAPQDPVAAMVSASWRGDASSPGVQQVDARLSPAYPGAYGELGVCQRGEVAVDASRGGKDPDAGPRLGKLLGGRREVRSTDGSGRLVIAEAASAQDSVPDYGANDFAFLFGWYLTAVDPEPGTYRWSSAVTWQPAADAAPQPGTLVVEITLG